MKKRIISFAVVAIFVATSFIAAYAASSNFKYFSANGRAYRANANLEAYNGTQPALCETGIAVDDGKGSVAQGWMGLQTIMYDNLGKARMAEGNCYNSSAGTWFVLNFVNDGPYKGNAQVGGYAYAYNGSSYNTTTLNKTPFAYVIGAESKSTLPDDTYQVNDNMQTYGSGAFADVENLPDLISAEGIDGKSGYVYKEDLLGEPPASPEEAIKRSQNSVDTFIPVYDKDGKTKIDEFKISKSNANIKTGKSKSDMPEWLK